MSVESQKEYEIKDGTLRVFKDLRQDYDHSFDQACSDLLSAEEDALTIDLDAAAYINSTYLGMIAATFFQAQANGKTLCVRGKKSVLQVLRAAGFDGFINLEKIE